MFGKPKKNQMESVKIPANLNRWEKKQIRQVVEKARKDNGVPRTAQQSIPFDRMFQDGICRVRDGYYTKTIQFQDINYQLAQQEDRAAIFEEWCSFLNFFDSSVRFELSFVNMCTASDAFEKTVRIPFQQDGFDSVRSEYSSMLKKQLAQGNNGLTKTKYLTFGIEAETMRQAKPKLEHVETDLLNNFKRLGVSARVLNDYPEDLMLLDCPHVYRPADSSTYLDEAFTDFTLAFVPLGQEEMDSASAQTIASALRPSGFDFVVTTGSRENQVMLARALGMDTVTLEGGSVSFSTVLKDADSTSASFSLTEDKDVTIIPADQMRELTLSSDLDIASWIQTLTAESEADISSLESLTAGISDSQVILALSAGQPASSDWTPFTPYSYRTEYSWPVSDYLTRTFSDSYAATHYSAETDSGVTLVTDVLHERMDRLYTRGLIEAGTSVLSLPVLSDAEPQRFAVTAVYIHP